MPLVVSASSASRGNNTSGTSSASSKVGARLIAVPTVPTVLRSSNARSYPRIRDPVQASESLTARGSADQTEPRGGERGSANAAGPVAYHVPRKVVPTVCPDAVGANCSELAESFAERDCRGFVHSK